MSDPNAERAPGGIGAGALVGIALGLMVLAAAAAFLLVGRGGPVDGRAELQAAFGGASLPFGLEVVSATRMAAGETLVVLERSGAPPEPPRQEPKPAAGQEPPRVDWSALPIPAAQEPPRQVALLLADGARGRAVLDALLRDVVARDRRDLGAEGGTVIVDRGRLDFRGWDSDWIHLRTFEAGGTFRDAVRVSLSTPERPCVLTATWPRGSAASKALLDALIAPLNAPRSGK
jgi:hypothetical protein